MKRCQNTGVKNTGANCEKGKVKKKKRKLKLQKRWLN